MGLLQQAALTYDHFSHLAGVQQEGKETLAPIGHLITEVAIEVTLDADGNFIHAEKSENKKKIVIPVTEESAGRTSGIEPHALCDQIGYLCGKNKDKLDKYTEGLKKWEESNYGHPKLTAVLHYIQSGTLLSDLEQADLIKYDENKNIKNEKDLVAWIVTGMGDDSGPVWTDRKLIDAYMAFYIQERFEEKKDTLELCMLSGKQTIRAKQHLKGVVAQNGNAKIISSNDETNFTYRGRFCDEYEALTIGYEMSQKAHNALKWLVSNEGVMEGKRAFVCWNPHGIQTSKVHLPFITVKDEKLKPTEYHDKLKRTLQGCRSTLPDSENVIIVAFDAATSGRLAVTYYNELPGSDFSERMAYWDMGCCWFDSQWGCSSPTLYSIVKYAYGTQRGNDETAKVVVDDKIIAQHIQQLIACRINRSVFPQNLMRVLFERSSNLQIYSKKNRRELLFITCAVIRKYHIDHDKEEYAMALEPLRKDRSYQFGRMIAVMEKIERDTYDGDESREPNAIRMQSVFVQRPGYAAKIVMDQLKAAYYPRLKPGQRTFYERLLGEIMAVLSEFPESEYNRPLKDPYLLGYYLQKNALYTKKENGLEETNDEI